MCHSADCLFSSGSYDLIYVSSVATILDKKKSYPSDSNRGGNEWLLLNDVPLDSTFSDVAPS